MMKIWGVLLLIAGDVLLVRHLTDRKKKTVQCLWEIIGYLSTVTLGVTQWKKTLEKAVTDKTNQGVFAKLFREAFCNYRKTLPLRCALDKALEELPLPKEAISVCSLYFTHLGKTTEKSTEESFRHTKLQLEKLLKELQEELPKSKKLICAGVYSMSAMVTVLLL